MNQITVLDDKVNSYVEEIDSQKVRLKEFEDERFHLQSEITELQEENQRLREKEAASAEMTLIETDSYETMICNFKTVSMILVCLTIFIHMIHSHIQKFNNH